ncbi:MAG: hypothetical protein V4632_02920 [Pseudomonadota bacterium]
MSPFLKICGLTFLSVLVAMPSAYAAARSPADCAAEADYAARNSSPGGEVARGAVRGAAFGAIVDGSDSAGRGAGVGVVASGARKAKTKDSAYRQIYNACMSGK